LTRLASSHHARTSPKPSTADETQEDDTSLELSPSEFGTDDAFEKDLARVQRRMQRERSHREMLDGLPDGPFGEMIAGRM
jgi:hypothetical protein